MLPTLGTEVTPLLFQSDALLSELTLINIPLIALATLAQIGEHQTGMIEILRSIPTRSNFLAFHMYDLNTNIANYAIANCNYEKLD